MNTPIEAQNNDRDLNTRHLSQAQRILQLEDEISTLKALLKRPKKQLAQHNAKSLVASLRVSMMEEWLY